MGRVPKNTINNHVYSNGNYSDQLLMECLQRDGRFIMSGPLFLSLFFVLIANTPTILWRASCGRCKPKVGGKCFVVRWSAQQTIGSRSASLVKWFGCWILCIVVLDDWAFVVMRVLAQFFDEYKFVFPVHASSIGHGHPKDCGHGQKVVPKPELSRSNKSPPKVPMFSR